METGSVRDRAGRVVAGVLLGSAVGVGLLVVPYLNAVGTLVAGAVAGGTLRRGAGWGAGVGAAAGVASFLPVAVAVLVVGTTPTVGALTPEVADLFTPLLAPFVLSFAAGFGALGGAVGGFVRSNRES